MGLPQRHLLTPSLVRRFAQVRARRIRGTGVGQWQCCPSLCAIYRGNLVSEPDQRRGHLELSRTKIIEAAAGSTAKIIIDLMSDYTDYTYSH
jgi:hypothetical protein